MPSKFSFPYVLFSRNFRGEKVHNWGLLGNNMELRVVKYNVHEVTTVASRVVASWMKHIAQDLAHNTQQILANVIQINNLCNKFLLSVSATCQALCEAFMYGSLGEDGNQGWERSCLAVPGTS